VKIDRPLRVELEGRGKITLDRNDYVASGGEGSVYRRGDLIIKLYADPAKMLRDDMSAKIRTLVTFKHPYIVAPRGLVLDGGGKPIGYYMDFATGEPFARVFTNKFRTRAKFGDHDASLLTDRMLQVFRFAHDRQAVLVDANELNWIAALGGADGPEPRILDVDSWAVGKWPAKVVMLSIRDFHTKGLTPLTDMFSWGIVTFQLYTGIHPYKGELAGYGMLELERRMRDNASVFSTGVQFPSAVRDFGCIPGPLLGWYEATFQQGERTQPPSPFDTGVTTPARRVKVARITTTTSGKLDYQRLLDDSDPAMRVFPCGIVLLESGKLYDLGTNRVVGSNASLDCEVVKGEHGWVVGEPNGGEPTFTFISTSHEATVLTPNVQGTALVRYENRLFVTTDRGLTELKLMKFARTILAVGDTWGAMPRSTQWFDGVGVQDAMGATFLIAPFGDGSCGQVRTRELDGLHVVAAKAGNRFVSIIALDSTGLYKKIEFTFDETYSPSYTVWEGAALNAELNMAIVTRPGGAVGATVVRDGELVIFVPTTGVVNKVPDKDVTTTMTLTTWRDRVVYIRDGQVWSLTLK